MDIRTAIRLEISLHRAAADALQAALFAIEAAIPQPLPNSTAAVVPSVQAATTSGPAGSPNPVTEMVTAATHPGQLFDTAPDAQRV